MAMPRWWQSSAWPGPQGVRRGVSRGLIHRGVRRKGMLVARAGNSRGSDSQRTTDSSSGTFRSWRRTCIVTTSRESTGDSSPSNRTRHEKSPRSTSETRRGACCEIRSSSSGGGYNSSATYSTVSPINSTTALSQGSRSILSRTSLGSSRRRKRWPRPCGQWCERESSGAGRTPSGAPKTRVAPRHDRAPGVSQADHAGVS